MTELRTAALAEEGSAVDELETPCLLVDLDRLERNVERWQEQITLHGPRLRPHIKTHKIPEIAAMQLAAGATGIAVAKVAEAEVFAERGCTDIVIAYPVVGPRKWERIAALAESVKIAVNVDSGVAARGLSAAASHHGVSVGVHVEIDTGFGRCGFRPADLDSIEQLARLVHKLPGLELEGVTTHRGIFFAGAETMTLDEAGAEEGRLMVEVAERLRDRGVAVREVTAGGTITGRAVAGVPGITEVRAGTYVFQDLMQLGFGSASADELALSVLCTVVSHQAHDRATIDGGSKTFSGDRGLIGGTSAGFDGVGRAVDRDVVLARMSEEHGMVHVGEDPVEIGERIAFYPVHACTCVNLANEVYGVRGGVVEKVWPVLARGKRT
jgi:D-serine deaminase-like pyridoxal phosphate-dependent protein